jgi:hypothetical protein
VAVVQFIHSLQEFAIITWPKHVSVCNGTLLMHERSLCGDIALNLSFGRKWRSSKLFD